MRVRKFTAPFKLLGWRWHSMTHTELICVWACVNVCMLSSCTQTHPLTWAWACIVSHETHLNHLDCACKETKVLSIFSHLSFSLFCVWAASPAVRTNLIILALQLTLITLSCAVCMCSSTTSSFEKNRRKSSSGIKERVPLWLQPYVNFHSAPTYASI